jgi:hypothetical protein
MLPNKCLAVFFLEDRAEENPVDSSPEDAPDRRSLGQTSRDGENRPYPGMIETAVLVGPVVLV